MIPSHPRMPKTTDAININNFLNKVFKNKNIGKKIKKFNRKNKNKNFSNISDVINYFLNNKIIENEIETLLLELYFSSKVTKKKNKYFFKKK